VKRPVILNGVEGVATRPDLAERVLQIELETIPDANRISEKALWRELEKQRAVIGVKRCLKMSVYEGRVGGCLARIRT
jgi:hypothetical protein